MSMTDDHISLDFMGFDVSSLSTSTLVSKASKTTGGAKDEKSLKSEPVTTMTTTTAAKVPVPSLVLLSKAIAVQVSFWWCRKDINPYSFGFLSHSIHWSNRILLYLF